VAEHLKNILVRIKPAVGRQTLLFMGGFVWVCVGGMLLTFSGRWLGAFHDASPIPFVLAGVFLALVVHHFGFLKIVDRNLGRLLTAREKKCVFYFMPWKSYPTVAIMAVLGVLLRHSPIPRQYLAILYIGIGLGLILSSMRYFRVLFRQGWK
jgi:hypothetical protein